MTDLEQMAVRLQAAREVYRQWNALNKPDLTPAELIRIMIEEKRAENELIAADQALKAAIKEMV